MIIRPAPTRASIRAHYLRPAHTYVGGKARALSEPPNKLVCGGLHIGKVSWLIYWAGMRAHVTSVPLHGSRNGGEFLTRPDYFCDFWSGLRAIYSAGSLGASATVYLGFPRRCLFSLGENALAISRRQSIDLEFACGKLAPGLLQRFQITCTKFCVN